MTQRRRRLGLRARATIGFGLMGLVVAVVLAAVTYTLARGYLVDQRQETATRQAYVNARLARTVLRASEPDVRALLAGLGGGTASTAVVRYLDEWFSTSVTLTPDAIPQDLVRVVTDGGAGHQRYRDASGDLHLATGTALPAVDGAYFELFPLDELERTLDLLLRSLAFGVVGAALTAAVVGRLAANRLVRPIRPLSEAAEQVAAGALDTRLDPEADPDLRRLGEAFNRMASSLESRIQREARFAADVSHELRSPLAALAAAVDVIDRRRAQLPEQVILAFEVLAAKVDSFQQMVLDLLEISRMDAGTAQLDLDLVDLRLLLRRLVDLHGARGTELEVKGDSTTQVWGDRRRLTQVFVNVIENANRYAGGLTRVSLDGEHGGMVRIVFDDGGPGLSPEEQETVFHRFSRGRAGLQTGSGSGSGLGLALVAEHVRLHGGRVRAEGSPAGGARFVIELPVSR